MKSALSFAGRCVVGLLAGGCAGVLIGGLLLTLADTMLKTLGVPTYPVGSYIMIWFRVFLLFGSGLGLVLVITNGQAEGGAR